MHSRWILALPAAASCLVSGACQPANPPALSTSPAAETTESLAQADSGPKILLDENGKRIYRKPTDAEIRARLDEMQYSVTQHEGTERPFANKYWDNKEAGIYVDIVSGEPLFSSLDKYKSGTGWPSFTRPLVAENIVEKVDYGMILPRTEVRSKHGDSHLGHVFDDGPEPTGLRYCMNSAAMRFIPADKLRDEGHEEFTSLFETENVEEPVAEPDR